jgi:protein O-GlcNAc transferase
VGVSLLERTGLGDLVTYSPAVYVARACALAADRDRLAELRAGMRQRVAGSPLGDVAGFTRELEDLYRRLWEDDANS